MRIEEVYDALDRAKCHTKDAADTETFADMRLQLEHAKAACNSALKGIEALIKGARGEPTILPRAPRG
jgi:hypothetical protein